MSDMTSRVSRARTMMRWSEMNLMLIYSAGTKPPPPFPLHYPPPPPPPPFPKAVTTASPQP